MDKTSIIRDELSHDDISSSVQPPTFTNECLFHFAPITEQLSKIIVKSKPTSSSVDPISTKTVLDCLEIPLPVILNIINESLISGIVPKAPQMCCHKTSPEIKPGLDPNLPKGYRPVSNLTYFKAAGACSCSSASGTPC